MSVSPAQLGPANARIQDDACLDNVARERMKLEEVRSGRILCSGPNICIGSWNVERFNPM